MKPANSFWKSAFTLYNTLKLEKKNHNKGNKRICILHVHITCTFTVKSVLETMCIKRPPALRDHCSDTAILLNPFPNKPWFLRVCSTSLLKTLWEKEKLLVTSNFSFSHSVFLPICRTFCHFHLI